jgi:hypothetical protein
MGAPPVKDHGHPRFGLRPSFHGYVTLFYSVAAVVFVPWIVLLYLSQRARGEAHNLPAVTIGIVVIQAICLLWTAWTCRRRTAWAVMAATAIASLIFITSWFHDLTHTASGREAANLVGLVVLLGVMVVSAWLAHQLQRRRGDFGDGLAWTPFVYVVAALLLAVAVPRLAAVTPSDHPASHLRLIWVGLDVAELVGLVATAWTLRYRSSGVAVAATYTGTLVFCDAWFNVVSSSGGAAIAAVAMAFIELPVAALSFVVAGQEIRSWSGARSAPPGGPDPTEVDAGPERADAGRSEGRTGPELG